jgi:hypothetical protein
LRKRWFAVVVVVWLLLRWRWGLNLATESVSFHALCNGLFFNPIWIVTISSTWNRQNINALPSFSTSINELLVSEAFHFKRRAMAPEFQFVARLPLLVRESNYEVTVLHCPIERNKQCNVQALSQTIAVH